jgi:hypothetical protein
MLSCSDWANAATIFPRENDVHPSLPDFRCVQVELEGVGPCGTLENGEPNYQEAYATVTWANTALEADGESSWSLQSGCDAILYETTAEDGSVLTLSKLVSNSTLRINRLSITNPESLIQRCKGRVNQSAWKPSGGTWHDPETVLFVDADIERVRNARYGYMYRCVYNFQVRDEGWNCTYNGATGLWEYSSIPIYETTHFYYMSM